MDNPLFLYHYSYQDTEEALAKFTFDLLFPQSAFSSLVVSELNYDLDNWIFLHFKIAILCWDKEYEDFKQKLSQLNLHDWYLGTWHYNKTLDFNQRIKITKELASVLPNEGKMTDYSIELAWVFLNDFWYFGIINYNKYSYKLRVHKPFQYSSALPVRLCHQLANLLNLMMPQASFVDPAAGSGTLVIEALIVGLDIRAYEINKILCHQANANLKHYGLLPIIENRDLLQTTAFFDVCLLDLPYGLFTAVAEKQQLILLHHCLKISNHLLLISTVDYSDCLKEINYKITWQFSTSKAKFTRLISFISK